jgi:hypothetical protein
MFLITNKAVINLNNVDYFMDRIERLSSGNYYYIIFYISEYSTTASENYISIEFETEKLLEDCFNKILYGIKNNLRYVDISDRQEEEVRLPPKKPEHDKNGIAKKGL